MEIEDKYITVDEPSNTCFPQYTWLEVPEGADNQWARYMTYLETRLKNYLDEKRLSLLDVAKDQTALSISDPRLPFNMTGTANVLLVDARLIQHREPLAGVRMVIDLKKKVERRHKAQAFGELNVLTHLRIVHPKNAFDFIAAAVAELANLKPFSVPFIGRELTKFKIGDFLPMPDDGADEMMERYELMADVVEPEFLMARRKEYARHLAQSRPMHAHMNT
ncbi:unnamed protein product [Phytophthora lilii]|uniref:Unnamed protein product n=1 Tax=Phytophthora lilii TaxID=2077276 RepID=A0A9W6YFI3_9STRA|nr:unnamed protein product [Phytophthora lilii]